MRGRDEKTAPLHCVYTGVGGLPKNSTVSTFLTVYGVGGLLKKNVCITVISTKPAATAGMRARRLELLK